MLTLLRSYVFMTLYTLSIFLVGVFALPVVFFAPTSARSVAKAWARGIMFLLKRITGVSHRIEGAENIPEGGAIVAVNHQSQWETIALYAYLSRPTIIAKRELVKIPIYGLWLRRLGNIIVDRQGGAKALRKMRNEAATAIADGCQIVVFPESTRSPVGEKPPFHPGVAGIYAAANAPCVPAAHDSGRHWRYPGLLKVPGVITLRFLSPIAPGLDRKRFMQTLQDKIEGARPDLDPATRATKESHG